jgi:hypothetical protein
MNHYSHRSLLAALALSLLAFTLSLSTHAGERKDLTYSTKFGPVLSRTSASPGDRPNHEITQTVREDMTTSSDPDWDGVPLLNYSQSDLVAGSGTVSGYAVRTHKNGDKTFYRFHGQLQATGDGASRETTGSGTVELTGGTGKFARAKGSGTWTSAKGGATIKLDIEY